MKLKNYLIFRFITGKSEVNTKFMILTVRCNNHVGPCFQVKRLG